MSKVYLNPTAYYQVEYGVIKSKNSTKNIYATYDSISSGYINQPKAVLFEFEVAQSVESANASHIVLIDDNQVEANYNIKDKEATYVGDTRIRSSGTLDSLLIVTERYYQAKIGDKVSDLMTSKVYAGFSNGFFSYKYIYIYIGGLKDQSTATGYTSSGMNFTYGPLSYLTFTANPKIVINYSAKASFSPTSDFLGGFVDYRKPLVIKYSANATENTIGQYTIKSGTFHYKRTTDSTYSNIAFTGDTLTIPANTFANGQTYDIYTTVIADDDSTGDTTLKTLLTVDTLPTVYLVNPKNNIVYGDINFKWEYSNETGTEQYAFDLQLSDDGVNFTTIFNHVITSNTNIDYYIDTAGYKYWRVRGYNQNNNYGEWSDVAMFINNLPPSPPEITNIDGGGRITVNWSATDQVAYEVEVYDNFDKLFYDSGIVATTNKLHLVNEYLPNGSYIVKVRIQNRFGKASEWATASYIQSMSVKTPEFELLPQKDGVFINITPDYTFDHYYLQRNGVTIAKITDNTYLDKFANGQITYTLIGVDSSDNFGISSQSIKYLVDYTRLVDLEGNIYDIHYRLGNPIGINLTAEADFSDNRYLGAETSDIDTSNFVARRYSVFFHYKEDFLKILGKKMLYADIYGNRDYIVCVGFSKAENRLGNEINAQFNSTIYNEAIEYDL